MGGGGFVGGAGDGGVVRGQKKGVRMEVELSVYIFREEKRGRAVG